MEDAASALRAFCETTGVDEEITWSSVGELLDRLSDDSVTMVTKVALIHLKKVMVAEALDCSDLKKFSKSMKGGQITRADRRSLVIAVLEKKDVGFIQQIISDLLAPAPSVDPRRALLAFDTTERCKPASNPPSRTLAHLLNRYIHHYRVGNYASPYTSVVGPSGIGKSASVKNMAMSNIQYVCYVSLASEDSSAVPRRSHAAAGIAQFPHAAAEILRSTQDPARVIPQGKRAFLCRKWSGFIMAAAIDVEACRRSGISPAAYFKIQTGDFNIPYANSLLEFGRELERWVDVSNNYGLLIEQYVTGRQGVLANCLPKDCTPVVPVVTEYESIIICLDEARALLSDDNSLQFRCFRQAIRDMNDIFNRKIFGILMDTTSRISNFSPAVQDDPSAKSDRVPEQSGKPLFAPIYTISTFDIFVDTQHFTGLDAEGSEDSVTQLFSCGRPLWGALLSTSSSIDKVFRLAREKLNGRSDDLPLMSQLIAFHILNSTMNAQYLERHMRYICEISPDRSFLSTFQPSEPILANVAAFELATDQHRQLAALKALYDANAQGFIDVGDIGEVVAMLIIIFSWASTQYSGTPYPKLITLRQFFQAMYPSALADSIYSQSSPGERALCDHGYVFCNHFVRVFGSVDQDMIRSLFIRGAGIIMPTNAPGADLILPVKYVDPHSSQAEMGCVLVQVKNRAHDSIGKPLRVEAEEAYNKLAHLTGNMKHLFVMMCLRGTQPHMWEVNVGSESGAMQLKSESQHTNRSLSIITMGCDPEIFPNVTSHGSHHAAVYSILHRLLRWKIGPRLPPDASDEVRDYMKETLGWLGFGTEI